METTGMARSEGGSIVEALQWSEWEAGRRNLNTSAHLQSLELA
jgi:hypothetical protein